jgi:Acyl-CoA dehydrogenase, C-terminal domain
MLLEGLLLFPPDPFVSGPPFSLKQTRFFLPFNRKEEGRSFTKEAAMAKYYSSVVAQKAAGSAIEWAGGVGFTRESGIEKYWRDSKIVSFQFPVVVSPLQFARMRLLNGIHCD